jgi:hypothetical protein
MFDIGVSNNEIKPDVSIQQEQILNGRLWEKPVLNGFECSSLPKWKSITHSVILLMRNKFEILYTLLFRNKIVLKEEENPKQMNIMIY